MSIGKTIARIEDRPTDLEYGYRRDNALLIIFTDGTAMEVEGWSREEVSLSFDEVPASKVAEYQRAAQGRREEERLVRLQWEEHASVSDEERARRREDRRAKMSPDALAMEDELVEDLNRMAYGDSPSKRTKRS